MLSQTSSARSAQYLSCSGVWFEYLLIAAYAFVFLHAVVEGHILYLRKVLGLQMLVDSLLLYCLHSTTMTARKVSTYT
jgi:hypothetical protein